MSFITVEPTQPGQQDLIWDAEVIAPIRAHLHKSVDLASILHVYTGVTGPVVFPRNYMRTAIPYTTEDGNKRSYRCILMIVPAEEHPTVHEHIYLVASDKSGRDNLPGMAVPWGTVISEMDNFAVMRFAKDIAEGWLDEVRDFLNEQINQGKKMLELLKAKLD